MKVLQYFENQGLLSKSGIGHAQKLQQEALSSTDVIVTTNAHSTDFDILHINTYGLWSMHQIKRAKRMGKKVIYHAHSTYEDFRNSFILSNLIAPFYKKWLLHLYSSADALITPTEYSKQLLQSYGLKQPIYPVSNGVQIEKYKNDKKKIEKFRQYIHAQPDEKIVISVGLYFERKGILDFVELAKRHPEYKFVWFGHTSMWLIPNKIKKILVDHPKNLIFPGYQTGDILQGAYSGADLFLYPSYEETEGIVVLEGLASSQKMLVRDIPVYDGWLEDRKNVYKAKDLTDFDFKMVQILSGKYKDLSKNGYRVAKNKNLPVVGHDLQKVYSEVLGEKVNVK
ncbi:MAG: glycosyltransferase family 4 protein [Lactobacillaceae bacterium]|jgi:1,2-diacylglycerol-3-alpha-glucose alpha-1,2-glucosyltransferase|nr:glycosyltransferase family 4 protein [Lactobacillaceae bacterium]